MKSRLEALISNLMVICRITPNPNSEVNLKMLRERMAGLWDVNEPIYSLLEPQDPLLQAIRRGENWRLLLLLRKGDETKDVLDEPARTPVLLKKLFDHLRELETKAKSGRTLS